MSNYKKILFCMMMYLLYEKYMEKGWILGGGEKEWHAKCPPPSKHNPKSLTLATKSWPSSIVIVYGRRQHRTTILHPLPPQTTTTNYFHTHISHILYIHIYLLHQLVHCLYVHATPSSQLLLFPLWISRTKCIQFNLHFFFSFKDGLRSRMKTTANYTILY